MADVEGFGDVGGGVLEDEFFALSGRVGAVLRFCGELVNLGKDEAGEGGCAEGEVKEILVVDDALDPIVRLELVRNDRLAQAILVQDGILNEEGTVKLVIKQGAD